MLSDSQITSFHRNGFLNGGPILADQEIDALITELDHLLEIGPDGFAEGEARPVLFHNMARHRDPERCVWQIVNIWEACPAYRKLLFHPSIVEAISQLTGSDTLQIWHDQLLYKPAGYGAATPWHQDAPLWPIIRPMTPVSAWIAIDDATLENGCMWMVPGSHRWGNRIEYLRTQNQLLLVDDFGNLQGFSPPDDAEITVVKALPRPVLRGEVSFHHSLTWHGSPKNSSDRPRRAIAIHYMTGEARFVASGQHVMKPYVNLEDGASMSEAGEHFPMVMKNGTPVGESTGAITA